MKPRARKTHATSNLDAEELRGILRALGWSGARCRRYLGISRSRFDLYKSGRAPMRCGDAELLRLLVRIKLGLPVELPEVA